jgi:excisionase family DNA binding protein
VSVAPLSRTELLALPPVTDLRTLARALGVSEPTIRERARRGELEAMGIRVLRLGAQYRIPTEDILSALGMNRDDEVGNGAA